MPVLQYVKTWMVIDLVALVPWHWFSVGNEAGVTSTLRVFKVFKVLRIVRILKIMNSDRLFNMTIMLEDAVSHLGGDLDLETMVVTLRIAFKMFQAVAMVFCEAHCAAFVYLSFPVQDANGSTTSENAPSVWLRYLEAVLWSATKLVSGTTAGMSSNKASV